METSNRTILIVDDESETLDGYRQFLMPRPEEHAPARRSSRSTNGNGPIVQAKTSPAGYELLLASSGDEAVAIARDRYLKAQPIAAGFFDVRLGKGLDGLQTIVEVRKIFPEIHCTVVTAYHDRSVEEINTFFGDEFQDHWDYLNKPFTRGEIIQKALQMVSAWNRKRELGRMQQQLILSERQAAVGQLARGIGHEFGNILLRIMGKADLARLEKDPSKMHEHLEVILRAADRAGVIVKNLQTFARSEESLENTSLANLFEESLSLVEHELKKSGIKVMRNFGEVPEIRLERGKIAQVFLNLIINAIHAMPSGGSLTLGLSQVHGTNGRLGVAATVSDTGTGISPDVLPRIFDFAFTTKQEKGSGLGLSISRNIVESHRGAIDVQTELGKGTEFTVWLPLTR